MSSMQRFDELENRINILTPLIDKTIYDEQIISNAEELNIEPREYLHDINVEYVILQREFNRLIDITPDQDKSRKYVIDTYNLRTKDYNMLEPVEINLKKRIKKSENTFVKFCAVIAENEKYRFCVLYFNDLLRENKETGEVVYFGKGSSCGCIYHDKLYLYESDSIMSDKFICRFNVEDSSNFERLDILSNKKQEKL